MIFCCDSQKNSYLNVKIVLHPQSVIFSSIDGCELADLTIESILKEADFIAMINRKNSIDVRANATKKLTTKGYIIEDYVTEDSRSAVSLPEKKYDRRIVEIYSQGGKYSEYAEYFDTLEARIELGDKIVFDKYMTLSELASAIAAAVKG